MRRSMIDGIRDCAVAPRYLTLSRGSELPMLLLGEIPGRDICAPDYSRGNQSCRGEKRETRSARNTLPPISRAASSLSSVRISRTIRLVVIYIIEEPNACVAEYMSAKIMRNIIDSCDFQANESKGLRGRCCSIHRDSLE